MGGLGNGSSHGSCFGVQSGPTKGWVDPQLRINKCVNYDCKT